jgi:hypothetical protein
VLVGWFATLVAAALVVILASRRATKVK